MRSVGGLILLLFLPACSQGPSITGAYVRLDEGRISNPPDEPFRETVGSATALLFLPDGTFVEHHFYARESDGKWSVSPGDPHIAAIGTWVRNWGTLAVSRTRVARTVAEISALDSLCASSLGATIISPTEIRFNNQTYVLSSTEIGQLSAHVPYIRDAKQGKSCGGGV